jgi:hypothetical protein
MATVAQQVAALTHQLNELKAEVTVLREQMVMSEALLQCVDRRGYERGRESILGKAAEPRPQRQRHLRSISDGSS